MENHVEDFFIRLKQVVSQDHDGEVTREERRTPILATLSDNMWGWS